MLVRRIASFVVLGVAIATIAQSALAGVMVTVTPQADPLAGLNAFKVTLAGTGGANLGGISLMSLTGVQNVWQNAAAAAGQKTPVVGNTGSGAFGIPGVDNLDTHLLVNPNGGLFNLSPGFGLDETNDASNPASIPAATLSPPSPFNTFPGSAGLGNLTMTGSQATMAWLSPQPASSDFLYIVLKAGTQAHLVTDLLDSTAATTHIDQLIGGSQGTAPTVVDGLINNVKSNDLNPANNPVKFTFTATGDAPITWGSFGFDSFTQGFGGPAAGTPGVAATFDPATQAFSWLSNNTPRGIYKWHVTATNPTGSDQGFLTVNVTAVPEPASLTLLGLATLGFVGIVRRRS